MEQHSFNHNPFVLQIVADLNERQHHVGRWQAININGELFVTAFQYDMENDYMYERTLVYKVVGEKGNVLLPHEYRTDAVSKDKPEKMTLWNIVEATVGVYGISVL